jgi:hypothetical protein
MRSYISAATALGSATIMVQDLSFSPVVRSFHSVPETGEGHRLAVGAREVVRLLVAGLVLPLVIAGGRDKAARALENIAEERLSLHGLGGSATTSIGSRALKVAARSSFSGLDHHQGTKPRRIRTKSRLPSWVGQTL